MCGGSSSRTALKTSDFDYALPPELIAQHPAEPRDSSRLLVVNRAAGSIEHHAFSDLARFLREGDLMVLNDSRVIPARLHARKRTGGKVEILLLRRLELGLWEALVRPSARVAAGEVLAVESARSPGSEATAEVLEANEEGVRSVRLKDEDSIEVLGEIPLPPYIRDYRGDPERYQTVYSREKGSVAAPTAGLHFTPAFLDGIRRSGVETVFVTLHVGLDTFRPIREEDPRRHRIHREFGVMSAIAAESLSRARSSGRRIICVGTTSVRIVEQAALSSPGLPVRPFRGWVDLYVLPGHPFRLVDAMITNFHLPRSTLLMLVSAFGGTDLIRRAYTEAVARQYRFYSFGDAMLIL